jgi:Zn-dependent protease
MAFSPRILQIKGIDVRLHLTFLFLLAYIVLVFSLNVLTGGWTLASAIYWLAFFIVLFGSVLFHELVHSFVAMSNGIEVKQIILTPIGGIASIGMFRDAKKEFKVSVAGPLSNFLIAFILLVLVLALVGPDAVFDKLLSDEIFTTPSAVNFLLLVLYLNLILGAFNLFLPVFPMDGGRVLRSMLAMVTDQVRATRIAVAISQGFLAMLIGISILTGYLMLLFISVFLFVAGRSELKLTELAALMDRVDLKKAIYTRFMAISPDLRVRDLLQIAVPWQSLYPVLDDKGRPLGYVHVDKIRGGDGKVGEAMVKDFPTARLGQQDEDVLTKVYSNGFAFVLDRGGRLYGILTLENLQNALKIEAMKKDKAQ